MTKSKSPLQFGSDCSEKATELESLANLANSTKAIFCFSHNLDRN